MFNKYIGELVGFVELDDPELNYAISDAPNTTHGFMDDAVSEVCSSKERKS